VNCQTEEPPESFDEDGKTWFREDIDFVDIHEGQQFLVQSRFGTDYFTIYGPESATKKSDVAKGKSPMRPVPPTKDKGKSTPSKKVKEDKGDKPAKPVPPTQQDSPLGVKVEPRSNALSDSQRASLRKFFELPIGNVPPEEWTKMDKKQKSAASKARSLPRWATTAVLKRPGALDDILSKKLTKDNVKSELGKLPQANSATGQALEAWTKLKNDFAGVTLYLEPRTSREKALKKRFDQLVLDYGEQKCFPKPRQHPDRQSQQKRGGRENSPSRGMGDLIDMAKAMGEIARAFRS
jgi:hypothetical protein